MKPATMICFVFLFFFLVNWVEAREIGFIEEFSLSENRSEFLKQLIPGTEDYYYYHCLHAQLTGDMEQVHRMLQKWIERQGYTDGVNEMLNRQALLEYEKNPKASLAHIRKALNLTFDHRKEHSDRTPDLPTTLDPKLISTPTLLRAAYNRYKNLDGLEDAGLDSIDYDHLTPERRRDLLRRINLPDLPGLPKLVVADLKYEYSEGFGSLPIHNQLLKSQMEECRNLMPELAEVSGFVMAYINKLAPSQDVDLRYDKAERASYLDRLYAFVAGLSPVFNSLKAHVVYHKLDMDRKNDRYEKALFMEYLQLPRQAHYMSPDYLNQRDLLNVRADLNTDFSASTGLSSVGSDEELVRDYLSHLLMEEKDYKAYDRFIQDRYLKEIFSETKIVNGIGDMEKWSAMLGPDHYRQLKDRVDLDFSPANPIHFNRDEPVALELYTKNVRTLMIKIYEMNTFNYYRNQLKEIDTAVNLDGLTATWEKLETSDDNPVRRVKRKFDFPQIDKPGVFVVEFIGNGRSSRALIRKGLLSFVNTVGPAGHEFLVFDEHNEPCPKASIWMTGREYLPGEDGVIIIPFSNEPGHRNIIVKNGDLCTLAAFGHQSERYTFSAGFYVDRESLIKGARAKLLVRPVLALNGHPVSLSLLEETSLSIEAENRHGVVTTNKIGKFALFEDKEAVHEFQVPEELARIRFSIESHVRNVSSGEKVVLNDTAEFPLNGIDAGMAVENVFLSHTDKGYLLEVLGKTGEQRTHQPVVVELKHRYFRELVRVTLGTDENGRTMLGPLDTIDWIQATVAGAPPQTWPLARERVRYPADMHEQAGTEIRIPYAGPSSEDNGPRPCSLLEKRQGIFVADHTQAVTVDNGFLSIKGLAAGDYLLFLKADRRPITIRITDGRVRDGFIVSASRSLERKNTAPVHISSVDVSGTQIVVQLANTTDHTRVHAMATRFVPAYDLFSNLVYAGLPEPGSISRIMPQSQYVAGRNIGDEFRYILERKYAGKYPGNMLNRPQLLLNPWPIHDTETGVDVARPDEAYTSEAVQSAPERMAGEAAAEKRSELEGYANLDFVDQATWMQINLVPDKNGKVVIERAALGSARQLHLLAVDPFNTSYRESALPPGPGREKDLRLVGLPAQRHFTEKRDITFLTPGQRFQIDNPAGAEFEIYDSLGKVYQLLTTLSNNAVLKEFRFIMDWPDLDEAAKQEKYAVYACHELNFFLYRKDPAFFKAVVLPHLRYKKDKTFMDQWLLGEALSPYLDPWAFSRLNIVEKILLAGRVADQDAMIKKHVSELFELLPPPDMEVYYHLFETALKGRLLERQAYAPKDEAGRDEEMVYLQQPRSDMPMVAESQKISYSMDDIKEAPSTPKAKKMQRADKKSAPPAAGGVALFKGPRERERAQARQFFRKIEPTREWAENNYYKLPIEAQTGDLINVNPFWNDYARSKDGSPFLSVHFPYATGNFTEMMLALSLLDLPFKAGQHKTDASGVAFSLEPVTPVIIFHKEIKEDQVLDEKSPLMVHQHYFNPNDPYEYMDGENIEKQILPTDEFLVHTPYGCRIVVANPTSSRQKLNLLMQIPSGAMPLNTGFFTRGEPLVLEPYETRRLEYYFYFPLSGQFAHYPAHIARNSRLAAAAQPAVLTAVNQFSRNDTLSWQYISQKGSDEAVIKFLQAQNLNRLDLAKIAFRLKEKGFYRTIIDMLGKRYTYNHTLWSYSILHNDTPNIREFLQHSELADRCGAYLDSPILVVDPVKRHTYQHLEYRPLINERAHRLGSRRKILNNLFYDQYQRFMTYLSFRPSLEQDDLLAVTYYLLLQDRVPQAMHFFEKLAPKDDRTRIQYDYMRAYLAFYKNDIATAQQIVAAYHDYPVPHWRNLYREMAAQLEEIAGKSVAAATEAKEGKQQHARMAATEPNLEMMVESRQVTLAYQHLSSCRVNYYPMDIELLFSRNPFVQQQTDQFAFIRPSETADIELAADRNTMTFDLPGKFHNSNLMIEVLAGGLRQTQVYYANSLDVQLIENYGSLKVMHRTDAKALAGVYIKVYAKTRSGEVRFYKDGYTDLRGRFDYASLSTDTLGEVIKFSILVLSEDKGALIREAGPPAQ